MADQSRYSFICDWYDKQASLTRQYELLYYASDCTVEMVDLRSKKMFLRRVKVDGLTLDKLYPGNSVMVLGRHLHIKDFSNNFSRNTLLGVSQKSIIVVHPSGKSKLGEMLVILNKAGLKLSKLKMCEFSGNETQQLASVISCASNGASIGLEVVGENAIEKCQQFTEPSGPNALSDAPYSFAARFGGQSHSVSVSNREQAEMVGKLLFEGCKGNTAVFDSSTLGIIKPHAVEACLAGEIFTKIEEANFEITAASTFQLSKAEAEEFFEVYKGVVHEYSEMVEQMTVGPCIALEIRAKDAHAAFREFCGPADPEIGRQLRPQTLRALFGETKARNAIHCTDLPEDAPLEVEYFFRILSS